MKKFLVIFLVMAFFSGLITACSDGSQEASKEGEERTPEEILEDIRRSSGDSENSDEVSSSDDEILDKSNTVTTESEGSLEANNQNPDSNNDFQEDSDQTVIGHGGQEDLSSENKPKDIASDAELDALLGRPDIDLTVLNQTMMYSELYNMLTDPEPHEGKIVRIRGQFSAMQDPATGKQYFACGVSDLAGCCQVGLEFVTAEDLSFPEDYPELNDTIVVQGEYHAYMEGGVGYRTLLNATFFHR